MQRLERHRFVLFFRMSLRYNLLPVVILGIKEGSQMPRHLISDAHEWINEIPTVPIYYLAKPQPRERAWKNQRGKKTLNLNGSSTGSTASNFKPRRQKVVLLASREDTTCLW